MSAKNKLDLYKKKIDANKNKFEPDARDWKCTLNKEGKGYAIIRFLDKNIFDENAEQVPWEELYRHQFKGVNGYYNELCLSSIDQEDPVLEAIKPLWKGSKKEQDIAKQRKRKKEFWSNIYVVKDPGNSENEGKVFRFKYGKKIFDKLDSAMNPEFPTEERRNPFDIQNGMNFILAIRRVDDFPNYEKCAFEAPAPLVEGREAQEKILADCHDLSELKNPENFKTYDALKAKYYKVTGERPRASVKEEDGDVEVEETTKTKTRTTIEDSDVDIDELMNS